MTWISSAAIVLLVAGCWQMYRAMVSWRMAAGVWERTALTWESTAREWEEGCEAEHKKVVEQADKIIELGIVVCRERERADATDKQALMFQRNTTHALRREGNPPRFVTIQDGVDQVVYLSTIYTGIVEEHHLKVRKVTVNFNIALAVHTFPEFVAGEIANRVRDLILKEYRSQSILRDRT